MVYGYQELDFQDFSAGIPNKDWGSFFARQNKSIAGDSDRFDGEETPYLSDMSAIDASLLDEVGEFETGTNRSDRPAPVGHLPSDPDPKAHFLHHVEHNFGPAPRVRRICTRLGERLSSSGLVQAVPLHVAPQIQAMGNTVHDLVVELTELELDSQYYHQELGSPENDITATVFKQRDEQSFGGFGFKFYAQAFLVMISVVLVLLAFSWVPQRIESMSNFLPDFATGSSQQLSSNKSFRLTAEGSSVNATLSAQEITYDYMPDGLDVAGGNNIIMLKVEIANSSSKSFYFSQQRLSLVSGQGTYKPISISPQRMSQDGYPPINSTIEPRTVTDGWVAFELPKGLESHTMQYKLNVYNPGQEPETITKSVKL